MNNFEGKAMRNVLNDKMKFVLSRPNNFTFLSVLSRGLCYSSKTYMCDKIIQKFPRLINERKERRNERIKD